MQNDYYVGTWNGKVSDKLERQIDKAVKELDSEACFYNTGNRCSLLVRPNDGWNGTSEGSAANKKMRDLVNKLKCSA